jgi:UDP-2,3-diacylglucosamine hydrolase
MKPALFVSDLHLAPPRPAVATAFHAWARGPARDACAVYVLGDLFDEWIGDEQADDPFTREVVASLRGIADAGVPVAVMHGNRDFHGDELCTDDADYQRYRAWIRDPRRQRRILALPWPVRRAFSAWLRRRSRNANRTKRDEIMDVNASAVAQALRDAGVARLVHGHTHRPAAHALDVDGRRCERHVLPDWHDRAVWLEVDPSGARRRELAP